LRTHVDALPARGLAAIKQVVLHTAQQQIVAAAAATGVGAVAPATMFGGVLMKKLMAGFAALASMGLCWWFVATAPRKNQNEFAHVSRQQGEVAAPDHEKPALPLTAADREPTARTPAAIPVAAQQNSSPTELWGRVVDAASKAPIANADIELLHRPADEFENLDLEYGQRVNSLTTSSSDADGSFRFAVARARPHRLRVRAGGYATATLLRNTGGSAVEIALTRGASLHGVVTSEGRIVAGADIEVSVCNEWLDLAASKSDASGRFHFTDLPAVAVYVKVRSPQFQESSHKMNLESGREHALPIDLPKGRELRGRVLDDVTGLPISNAVVSDSWVQKRCVRTDAEGRFSISGLHDEIISMLHVHAEGYASWSQNIGGTLAEERVVRLTRGGEVIGRLVDATGHPVLDAYLAVNAEIPHAPGHSGSDWLRAPVSGDGRFRAESLRADCVYYLMARAPDLGARVYRLPRALAAGERLDVGDVVLRTAGGIEGSVVDELGRPCAGASLQVDGTNEDSDAWVRAHVAKQPPFHFYSRSARADAVGKYRISGLAGGRYEITASLSGLESSAVVMVSVDDGAILEDVQLVLTRGLSLHGSVRRSDNQPLTREQREQLWLHVRCGENQPRLTMLAADGTFAIEGLAGSLSVTAWRAPADWSLTPRTVDAGTRDLELILEPSSFVAGQVVDGTGRPLLASVFARTSEQEDFGTQASTDAQGRFRISVPPTFVGKVVALPLDDFRETEAVEAKAGDEHLRLVQTPLPR
jgi:hypothetical protein